MSREAHSTLTTNEPGKGNLTKEVRRMEKPHLLVLLYWTDIFASSLPACRSR